MFRTLVNDMAFACYATSGRLWLERYRLVLRTRADRNVRTPSVHAGYLCSDKKDYVSIASKGPAQIREIQKYRWL